MSDFLSDHVIIIPVTIPKPKPKPEPRGAWGERFEYEGDKYDPSDESIPDGDL